MGASESRGCVSLGGGDVLKGPDPSQFREELFTSTKLPRNDEPIADPFTGVIPSPGELEYSWSPHRRGRSNNVAQLVTIPRPGGNDLVVEASVLEDSDLRGPDKVVLACCYKGSYEAARKDTSLGYFAKSLGVDIVPGPPRHSRKYSLKASAHGGPQPVLVRLDIKASDAFQGFWVLEIPPGLDQDRLQQIYSLLKRFASDLAFFRNTELVMPMVGFSSHSTVSADEVVEASLSWVYHCYRQGPNLRRVTFVVPTEEHLNELEDTFRHHNRVLHDLSKQLTTGSPSESELLRRPLVSKLEEALWSFTDQVRAYVTENEGQAGEKTMQARRRLATLKVMLHHVTLIQDAMENSSEELQLVRVLCGSGRSIAEAFVDFDPSMSALREMDNAQDKIKYVLQTLQITGNNRGVTAVDFEHIRVLISLGQVARNAEMSLYLNALDAIFAMQAVAHLVHIFFSGHPPSQLLETDEEANKETDRLAAEAAAVMAESAGASAGAPAASTSASDAGSHDAASGGSDDGHRDGADQDDRKSDGGDAGSSTGGGGAADGGAADGGADLARAVDMDSFRRGAALAASELKALAAAVRREGTGIKMTSHRHRLKSYNSSFLGSEAVDWLMGALHLEVREEALDLANSLLRARVFHSVSGNDPTVFEDSKAIYELGEENVVSVLLPRAELGELARALQAPDAKFELKERKKIADTFTGAQAVEYLAKRLNVGPMPALAVCQQLLDSGLVVNASGDDKAFRDDSKALYKFGAPPAAGADSASESGGPSSDRADGDGATSDDHGAETSDDGSGSDSGDETGADTEN